MNIPFVDLKSQYLTIQGEINEAINNVYINKNGLLIFITRFNNNYNLALNKNKKYLNVYMKK